MPIQVILAFTIVMFIAAIIYIIWDEIQVNRMRAAQLNQFEQMIKELDDQLNIIEEKQKGFSEDDAADIGLIL